MNRTTDGKELIKHGEDEFHQDGSQFEAGSFDAIRFGSGTKRANATSFHRILALCALAIVVASIVSSLRLVFGF